MKDKLDSRGGGGKGKGDEVQKGSLRTGIVSLYLSTALAYGLAALVHNVEHGDSYVYISGRLALSCLTVSQARPKHLINRSS